MKNLEQHLPFILWSFLTIALTVVLFVVLPVLIMVNK